jgi:hypothetical protein
MRRTVGRDMSVMTDETQWQGLDEVLVIFLAMFESCHHSGDSDGRCADVAEKLAQLFGWRQTYKVEKLQRSLADSVARRNLLQQQQQQQQQRKQLLRSGHVADNVRTRKVSDLSCFWTVLRRTKGLITRTLILMVVVVVMMIIQFFINVLVQQP